MTRSGIFWSVFLLGWWSSGFHGPAMGANRSAGVLTAKNRGNLWDGLQMDGPAWAGVVSRNNANFEGGNVGAITKVGPYEYVVMLRSDNDDALPEFWRRWWSMVLEVPTDRTVTITIKGAGQWAYYLPLISYDGSESHRRDEAWAHLPEGAVDQPDPLTLRIRHKFRKSPVAIARFVPYTLTRMLGFIKQVSRHQNVSLHVAGFSSEGRPMPVIRIGKLGKSPQRKVFIHSRTHPGEVGSSFLLEGLVQKLLSQDAGMERLREKVGFEILPILNVDGVYNGNNRVTPGGINLEGKWYPQRLAEKSPQSQPARESETQAIAVQSSQPKTLDPSKTPREVLVWNRWIRASLKEGGIPVVALNLHSSSVQPNEGLFVFPHFGPLEAGYSRKEANLFENQLMFMKYFQRSFGNINWFLPMPKDGGRLFALKNIPETWWWTNYEDQVMALTIEATYGRVPAQNRWMRPADLRKLGAAMAQGIAQYVESLSNAPMARSPTSSRESSLSH